MVMGRRLGSIPTFRGYTFKIQYLCFMKSMVNIDFQRMGKAFQQHVRQKAARSGSTIVYLKNGMLTEEDPKTHQLRILKQVDYKGY